ncbi:MAG TPA: methyltransferase [Actinocrinis sp.]|nr:methyltransferase [Actinocrinis sp.]
MAGDRYGERGRYAERKIELMFLPGLEDVVLDELADRLPDSAGWRPVPGRQDSIEGYVTGPLAPLLDLTTVVAPFLVLSFPVPRPKSLLEYEYLSVIVAAMREAVDLNRRRPPQSFRIEAAGSDSPVMRALARELEEASGLPEDPADGECVLRLRRTPEQDEGWDALIRISTLPLSARPWRVEGYAAAVNATVAAAMVRVSGPRAEDRVANLMCGSGTLLVERLLAGPAACAVGVDSAQSALAAAADNLEAAGLTDQVDLLETDLRDDEWLRTGPFDCLYADPPWGDKSGRHTENEALHLMLLRRAYAGAAEGARLVVLTHEIRFMERCLRATSDMWRLEYEARIFQKGHHPRIYLLARRDDGPAVSLPEPGAAAASPTAPAPADPDPALPRPTARTGRADAVAAAARRRLAGPRRPN